MKLISREQIENLAKFKSSEFLTTSFYLDTKKRKKTRKEVNLALKNQLAKGKSRLEGMNLTRKQKDSLLKDLDVIGNYCRKHLISYTGAGLALFSCAGKDFFQDIELPNSPLNRIIFDQNPYVRLLSAILNEHTRICCLAIDRKEAKWYDIYAGEITQADSLTGDIPKRIKEGGWEGYDSKRIERHINQQLKDYFKKTAQNTFRLLKKNAFDWFFLGCQDEYCAEFDSFLHPYIKKRMKGRLKISPGDSKDKVLQKTEDLVKELKIAEKEAILRTFTSEMKKGGLSVSGLKNTLRKINRGEVQTLLITRYLSKPGRLCPKCRFLYADEATCPSCRIKTSTLLDVVDEAVEAALEKNAQIRHITPPSDLNQYGDIGAILRYKT